jgi:protein TonB
MSGLAEDDIDQSGRTPASRWLRLIGGAVLLLAAVGIVAYLLKGLGDSGPVAKKQVTKISVLPDTPPPPPPPPPKEPPKETKEVKQEQPKPVEQPQAEPLKMEGAAGSGDSPFAAGQVSRDYIGGTPGNGGGMQFAFFSNALQRHVQDELARNRKIKLGDYRVQVNLWIGKDGSISRAELASSTGNADTDRALRAALSELGPLRTAVPDNLPQPIKLRITNRMTG